MILDTEMVMLCLVYGVRTPHFHPFYLNLIKVIGNMLLKTNSKTRIEDEINNNNNNHNNNNNNN